MCRKFQRTAFKFQPYLVNSMKRTKNSREQKNHLKKKIRITNESKKVMKIEFERDMEGEKFVFHFFPPIK